MLVLLQAVQEGDFDVIWVVGECRSGKVVNLILSDSGQLQEGRITTSPLTWNGRLLVN